MSAKLRLTMWFTLMMLLLCAVTLVFVLVINGSAAMTDDPAARLVKIVSQNAEDLEFDHGKFEWGDMHFRKRGVSCAAYDQDGVLLRGAIEQDAQTGLDFEQNAIRKASVNQTEYLVYDVYVDLTVGGIWLRGQIDANDRSGLMHTIVILTCTLLPALLVITIGGGWLIACDAFHPMERMMQAVGTISGGGDLSARLALKRGPSEMRRLGRTFDSMLERLEKSFRAEQQFASDASHELRTPVAIILAQCERARRKDETKEDFLASIAVIEEQGRRMSELTDDLLSLTRLEQGTDRYPKKRAELSGFVQASFEEFVPADARGITMRTQIEPDVYAEYNPSLLSRVIYNLLQNAYKYGKPDGNILVALHAGADEICLSVSDDGVGIAKENQEKIWRRFWQADAARGSSGGAGLGLAMVREIAQYHGGRAEVESELGEGSTFRVILPAVKKSS